jgi:hypothetical protein
MKDPCRRIKTEYHIERSSVDSSPEGGSPSGYGERQNSMAGWVEMYDDK